MNLKDQNDLQFEIEGVAQSCSHAGPYATHLQLADPPSLSVHETMTP
jgi:hypothetical protein